MPTTCKPTWLTVRYFDREGLYQKKGEDYPDNAFRFAAFSLAALEFLKHSGTPPAIIHCHDWQTALVPIYLRNLYQDDGYFKKSSVVFTLHNLGYQGLFPPHILPQISLHAGLFTIDALEYFGMVNLLKGGIVFSDFITTVSRKYAEEIQTAEFGYGLEGVLRSRARHLQGIVNGVDYEAWDPATDKLLAANYSPVDMSGKEACKQALLLESMGVRNPVLHRPVIGIVSRFASQKGFDLIATIAEQLASLDLYIVALGTGEPPHEELFRTMAAKHPEKFLVQESAYGNALAHQIEAGSDMFLMPSRYRTLPGSTRSYSLKYGAVPIVRATGGLDDTIEAFDGKTGTGFKFHAYSPQALFGHDSHRFPGCVHRPPSHGLRLVQNGLCTRISRGRHRQRRTPKFTRVSGRQKLDRRGKHGAQAVPRRQFHVAAALRYMAG